MTIREDVSVPYSSGQWLQQYRSSLPLRTTYRFQSPIHRVNGCNICRSRGRGSRNGVSVPYSSGQWLQLILRIVRRVVQL